MVVKYLCNDTALRSSINLYVLGHYGNEEDARIVFDDMIVQFIKSVFSNQSFQLQGTLNAYLMGIAKHLWYAETKKQLRHKSIVELDTNMNLAEEPTAITLMLHGEKKILLQKLLSQIGKNCREVLMYWAHGYNMEEITMRMNYQSEGMTRKKKSNCLKELIALIHNNPQLKTALT